MTYVYDDNCKTDQIRNNSYYVRIFTSSIPNRSHVETRPFIDHGIRRDFKIDMTYAHMHKYESLLLFLYRIIH